MKRGKKGLGTLVILLLIIIILLLVGGGFYAYNQGFIGGNRQGAEENSGSQEDVVLQGVNAKGVYYRICPNEGSFVGCYDSESYQECVDTKASIETGLGRAYMGSTKMYLDYKNNKDEEVRLSFRVLYGVGYSKEKKVSSRKFDANEQRRIDLYHEYGCVEKAKVEIYNEDEEVIGTTEIVASDVE